jgi:hypothetical protein
MFQASSKGHRKVMGREHLGEQHGLRFVARAHGGNASKHLVCLARVISPPSRGKADDFTSFIERCGNRPQPGEYLGFIAASASASPASTMGASAAAPRQALIGDARQRGRN